MEIKQLEDLNPNPHNPRTMSRDDARALEESIKKFGDLSGIVFNVQTGQLVGGHMRSSIFKNLAGEKQIVIQERFETPNTVGTVAVGYLLHNGEKYGYREVSWDPSTESAANIAANRIQGDWDKQLLAEANYQLSQDAPDLLALTGQSEAEIAKLMKSVAPDDEPQDDTNQEQEEDEKITFKLTPDQAAFVNRVLNQVKERNSLDRSDHGTALFYLAKYYDAQHPVEPEERLDDVSV